MVGRSWGSHTNVTLPLQFCNLGLPFPTLIRPAGHPKNGLKFLLVGRLVGNGEVTQTSCCLFSFVTRACPSRPFYTLRATPKTALNFGWSINLLVGWSVGWSRGSHTNVTLPLQFHHPGPPFLTLLNPAGHPQNGFKFWSVGPSRGSHTKLHCLFSFFTRARPSRPLYALQATPKWALNFGW